MITKPALRDGRTFAEVAKGVKAGDNKMTPILDSATGGDQQGTGEAPPVRPVRPVITKPALRDGRT
ncbi:MAG: hypothetical protein CMO47_11170, partial [Verrucomicrobiales bacterium]|nr:hypothetical protein [Verrucomicrobiales bacterium]